MPIVAGILCTGCAVLNGHNECELSASEDALLRERVRTFLVGELGDAFVFYDSPDSLVSVTYDRRDGCGLLIYPAGDSDTGGTLLHGEGKVLFNRGTLEPTELVIFGW